MLQQEWKIPAWWKLPSVHKRSGKTKKKEEMNVRIVSLLTLIENVKRYSDGCNVEWLSVSPVYLPALGAVMETNARLSPRTRALAPRYMELLHWEGFVQAGERSSGD